MEDPLALLLQAVRRLRFLQLRLLQLQHTHDQLGAGIGELSRLSMSPCVDVPTCGPVTER